MLRICLWVRRASKPTVASDGRRRIDWTWRGRLAQIKDQGHVSLKIYNVAGQLVRTLVNEIQTPQVEGFSVTWSGKNNAGQAVSSGVYFYKLVARNFTETRKMVLLK